MSTERIKELVTHYFPYLWRFILLASLLLAGLHSGIDSSSQWRSFGWYTFFLSFFHLSEFMTLFIARKNYVRPGSFLLDQDKEYHIAVAAGWIEYIIEWFFLPSLKQLGVISICGIILCTIGEIIRKSAILTAGENFDHQIEFRKRREHSLVTHGIYSWCRHPSYCGWFCWSIGTQLILCNPICTIAYTYISWTFFRDRIEVEEQLLRSFFGLDYVKYKEKVPSGVPFIPWATRNKVIS